MPPAAAAEAELRRLLDIMAALRDPAQGCPWDREQNFETIAPYTIEEAYEVADAIARRDFAALPDELGDLLVQVVYHARMAEEAGRFGFADVAGAIADKMVRRHPHVFGEREQGADATRQSRQWDEIKALERSQRARAGTGEDSVLADVPIILPALMRAAKLGRRAARVGFDWEHPAQVRDKVLEELGEIDAALAGSADPGEIAEEIGDLLFAAANWSLHLAIDPEEALRAANAKFERRFRRMERLASERGVALGTLDTCEWDALWREAKRQD